LKISKHYEKTLNLFNVIINKKVTKYKTFWHVESLFKDGWYNYILPTADAETFDFSHAEEIRSAAIYSGRNISYYINERLIKDYEWFLRRQEYKCLGTEHYQIKRLKLPFKLKPGETYQVLDGKYLEKYLLAAQNTYPDWEECTRYCKYFYDLQTISSFKNKSFVTFISLKGDNVVGFGSIIIDKKERIGYLHLTGSTNIERRQKIISDMIKIRCNYGLKNDINEYYCISTGEGVLYDVLHKLGFYTRDIFHIWENSSAKGKYVLMSKYLINKLPARLLLALMYIEKKISRLNVGIKALEPVYIYVIAAFILFVLGLFREKMCIYEIFRYDNTPLCISLGYLMYLKYAIHGIFAFTVLWFVVKTAIKRIRHKM